MVNKPVTVLMLLQLGTPILMFLWIQIYIGKQIPSNSDTSDFRNLISLLLRSELNSERNTEDVNSTFSLLLDILEILGSTHSVIDKTIALLRIIQRRVSS